MRTAARFLTLLLVITTGACSADERSCLVPDADWLEEPNRMGTALGAVNTIRLDRNATLRWNGERTTQQELSQYLRVIADGPIHPLTLFRPDDDAPCEDVRRVRSMMSRELQCAERHACGEGPEWSDYPDQKGADI